LRPHLVLEQLKDWPELPFGGSFEDNIEKCLTLLIPGQIGLDVEMNSSSLPSLRYDTAPTELHGPIAIYLRRQRSKLGCMVPVWS
jgi:hypothetical protein